MDFKNGNYLSVWKCLGDILGLVEVYDDIMFDLGRYINWIFLLCFFVSYRNVVIN